MNDAIKFAREADCFIYRFDAMASDCEARFETEDSGLALHLGQIVEQEARRIEQKYSRYRPDSLLSRINTSAPAAIELDEETAALISYAAECNELSEGRFDITSGVLRRIWKFDGSDCVPTPEDVKRLLPFVGWRKVDWRPPFLALLEGMEIDLGGLGKEYAVDTAVIAVEAESDIAALINFGGDLRVTRPRLDAVPWRVEIESVDSDRRREGIIALTEGAIATSGDARRFLSKDGVRYSHILDPRTGWPVRDPPRSVTVAAPTCLQAGILSTIAMLRGVDAEKFLDSEGAMAWIVR